MDTTFAPDIFDDRELLAALARTVEASCDASHRLQRLAGRARTPSTRRLIDDCARRLGAAAHALQAAIGDLGGQASRRRAPNVLRLATGAPAAGVCDRESALVAESAQVVASVCCACRDAVDWPLSAPARQAVMPQFAELVSMYETLRDIGVESTASIRAA